MRAGVGREAAEQSRAEGHEKLCDRRVRHSVDQSPISRSLRVAILQSVQQHYRLRWRQGAAMVSFRDQALQQERHVFVS
jgi:hypothetical protein